MLATAVKVVSTLRQYSTITERMKESGIDFSHHPAISQGHSQSAMVALASDAEVLIVGDDLVDEEVLRKAKKLKLLIRWGAGLDNVDIDAADKLGIVIKNTPGLFGEDVADMALSLAMNCVRQVSLFDRKIRSGDWPKETSFSFRSLTPSILGLGAVGKELARVLQIFGNSVRGYDPLVSAGQYELFEAFGGVGECVAGSNILFVCLPLTDLTRGSVNAELLDLLASPGFVINVGRGEVINQTDLLERVSDGRLAGAGLDVFEAEPLPHETLAALPDQLVLSSHNASNTHASISRANSAVDEIISAYLEARNI